MQSIFYPLEQLYKFLYLSVYDITGDYGIALILLSLFIYIILFPFNQKAQQIQNAEREVQSIIAPQIEEIKRRFHGKEQYEKIQRLYHRYAYHPIYAIRSAAGIVLQIPFFVAARSMLYALPDIKGVQWGIIQDLGKPDQLLAGINLLPFVMTFVTVLYAFVMPKLTKKEITQTVIIGFIFLIILYPAPSALLIFWTWNLLWSLLHCLFFDRLQWFNEYIESVRDFVAENELAFHIIFALVLTVGLFVPTEVYIKNANQLWFDYKDILKYFLADTVKYFVILLLVYVLCRRKKVSGIYLSLLTGLLFGVFIQSYIVAIDYGLFDGHEIDWEKYALPGLFNAFIWLVCLGAAFICFRYLKFNTDKIKKYIKPISFIIIAVQCVVLVITLKNNPIQKNIILENGKAGILTAKDLYTVSDKDNIIIFLIDAFDASIFEEIMQKNPEAIADLKDFTFHDDTTSSFGFTDFSLPEILTGHLYDPATRFPEYLAKAWDNNPYYKKLKELDFNINLYTSGNYVDRKAPVDNLIEEQVVMKDEVAESFGQVTKFRMSPHYLKHIYYRYNPGITKPVVFDNNKPYNGNDDIGFYTKLKKGLRLTDKNMFKFYYLSGVHPPYAYNENVESLKPGEKGTAYKQALGSLVIVREYLTQMKKLNVYNNTTFAVVADHGYHHELGMRPLFLLKHRDEEHNQIIINHISNTVSELMPKIFAVFDNTGKYITTQTTHNKRFFYYEDTDKTGKFIKYVVDGPAKNRDSWVSLGEIKKKEPDNRLYIIGEKIDFSSFGNSFKYKTYGWGDLETTYASLITQSEAELSLQMEGGFNRKRNYVINVVCNPLLNYYVSAVDYYALSPLAYRDIRLYANGIKIGEWRLTNKDTITLTSVLPESVLNTAKLNLRFSVANSPDSKQPELFQINEIQILEKESGY